MVKFIDEHRDVHGVEPICATLPIAPSTYYEHRARTIDPSKRPARAKRDEELKPQIRRVWEENHDVKGLYKTEVIRKRGPWRNIEDVEFATLEWVDWFNNRRLLEPLGWVPPVEYEEAFYAGHAAQAKAA